MVTVLVYLGPIHVLIRMCDLQIITEFCKSIGADAKQRQGLIRLAKKNGEKLGFLA
jgi:hypothetical protein